MTLSSEENADIYYTTDGSAVLTGGLPSDSAKLYTAPIPITSETEINVVVFDRAGNTTTLSGTYTAPTSADPTPGAPTDLSGTAGQESVALRWSATDPSITGYGVQAYDSAGNEVGPLRETTVKNLTVTGLTSGTEYHFTVKAKNSGGYGDASDKVGPLTPTRLTDQVTIDLARWKSGDFRVGGTASVVGAIVTVRPALPGGGIDRTRVLANAVVTAADAPETGGEYSIRLRNGAAPATRPATIYVESNGGGDAGPCAVAQG